MGKIKVLFLEDVGRHGRAGEVREVANGYARNHLLPNNLAVPATHDHLQRTEKIRQAGNERRLREQGETETVASRIQEVSLTFTMRASFTGRLFGSVTNAHIAERLSEALGKTIDRRSLQIEEPLRELGTYSIGVRLPQQIPASFTVVVEAEGKPSTEELESTPPIATDSDVPEHASESSQDTPTTEDSVPEESSASKGSIRKKVRKKDRKKSTGESTKETESSTTDS